MGGLGVPGVPWLGGVGAPDDCDGWDGGLDDRLEELDGGWDEGREREDDGDGIDGDGIDGRLEGMVGLGMDVWVCVCIPAHPTKLPEMTRIIARD